MRMTIAFTCDRPDTDTNRYELERMLETGGFHAPVVTLWADGEHAATLDDTEARP